MSRKEALEHLRSGRPQRAVDLLESWLRQAPTDAAAWFLLGAGHHALRRLDAAEAAFSKCIVLEPFRGDARLARITVLRDAGRLADALDSALGAARDIPENASLHYAAGLAADELGLADVALSHYERALLIDTSHEDALHNRGVLLLRAGRIDDAIENHERYVRSFPQASRACSVLVDALFARGDFQRAITVLDSFQLLAPGDVSGPVRRGVALAAMRRYDQARDCLTRAQAGDPGGVARFLARIAPRSDPRFMLSPENIFLWQGWLALGRCDWRGWSEFVSEMRRISSERGVAIEPAAAFMSLHLPLTTAERQAVARAVTTDAESEVSPIALRATRSDGPIRIGVISPDLRDHAVGRLVLPLFELLDRERFQLHAYSLIASTMAGLRARLHRAADQFLELEGSDDGTIAATIARDDIDILIDVSGHTTGTRFSVLARRPARIQALYLGYAGTLGSSCVDYAIVDDVVAPDPDGWSETRIRLPHTYFLYDFRQRAPEAGVSRPDYGLPHDTFVFCAFHKAEKVSPDTMQLWAQVMRRTEDSVLWLGSCPPVAQRNLRREAANLGIAPSRLVFAPFEPFDNPRYLARQRLGDLMLDAIHHNAISSACDALSVGLPVLTLRGSTMASRSCESLLQAGELAELVSQDKDAYVEKAVRLASDPGELNRIRGKILQRSSPLFDTAGRVRELENAFQEMWDRYLSKTRSA